MPRLDPGAGRIRTAHEFGVHEGGGEYNVARALRRVSAVLAFQRCPGWRPRRVAVFSTTYDV